MLYHHFEPTLSRYEPVVLVFIPVSAGSAGKFQIDLMGCVFWVFFQVCAGTGSYIPL